MERVWKDIEGLEGIYQVSNYGEVRSLERKTKHKDGKVGFVKTRLMSIFLKEGYPCVSLCISGKKKQVRVHRLVAMAFLPNPDNKPQVNHIDGVKENNNVNNLEWNTSKENIRHAFSNGLNRGYIGAENPSAKLNDEIAREVYSLAHGDNTLKEVAQYIKERYGISVSVVVVNNIKLKKSWKHIHETV